MTDATEPIEATPKIADNNNETSYLLNKEKNEKLIDRDLEHGENKLETKLKPKEIDDQTRLITYEELKKYRKSPLWKGLRFLLFGGLGLIFVALVTLSVLIVMMSSKCDELPEGEEIFEEAPTPVVYPRQLTVLSGQGAIFHCEFFNDEVEWRRLDPNGLFAEFPSGIEISEKNGQLKIPKVDFNHQGEFACQVKDKQSKYKNMNTPQVVRLIVINQAKKETVEEEPPPIASRNGREELPPLALKPRVDSYLMIASAGEPVHFRCWNCQFAECRTSHRLVWQKIDAKNNEKEVLKSHGPLGIERDAQSVFLIFQEVKQSDAGIYECLDQGTGAISSQVHLQVEPPRTPIITPMVQTVHSNTTAFIHCSVPGRTDAKLSWRLENGVEAEELIGVLDDGKGLLSIDHVKSEHVRHGYVCWAMYPRRADKQALHAGPAKIYVLGGLNENEEDKEQAKGEINEIKENERKEERSTKEIVINQETTQTIPEELNNELAEGKIEEKEGTDEKIKNDEVEAKKSKERSVKLEEKKEENVEEKKEELNEDVEEEKKEELKEEKGEEIMKEDDKKEELNKNELKNDEEKKEDNEKKIKDDELTEVTEANKITEEINKKETDEKKDKTEEKIEEVKQDKKNDEEKINEANITKIEDKMTTEGIKNDEELKEDSVNEVKNEEKNKDNENINVTEANVEEKNKEEVEEEKKEEALDDKKEDNVVNEVKENNAVEEIKKDDIEERKEEQVVEEPKEERRENEVKEEVNEKLEDKMEEKKEDKKEEELEEKKEDKLEEEEKKDFEEKKEDKEEKVVEDKEEFKDEQISEATHDGRELVENEEEDNKEEEDKKEEDLKKDKEEISGEATIQIEKLLHSITATGSKINETNLNKDEINEVKEEKNKNNTDSSFNDFWKIIDALMGVIPV